MPQTHPAGAESEGRLRRPVDRVGRGNRRPRCSCSRCACRTQVRHPPARMQPRRREVFFFFPRRSWMGTGTQFEQLGEHPDRAYPLRQPEGGRIAGVVAVPGSSSPDRWVTFGSPTTASTCSTAVPRRRPPAPTKRAASRARAAAGSAATHTVPMQKVATLAELNAYFARCDATDDHRRVGQRVTTVEDDFATERRLVPVPCRSSPRNGDQSLRQRVDRHARVTVRNASTRCPRSATSAARCGCCSGPPRSSSTTGPRLSHHARTHRSPSPFGSVTLVLDHYLEVLAYSLAPYPGDRAGAGTKARRVHHHP